MHLQVILPNEEVDIRAVSTGEECMGRNLQGLSEEGIKERIVEAKEQYFKSSMITCTEQD